ncbi:G-box-binding factor-like isoform X2 [Tigriopus californicus]|nr:G-box-binding factor-like isoform X2 [Tigriopus californicus]XP_059098407.1 G-box-binding factor-like isoform X2 [Tigriopus californicus]
MANLQLPLNQDHEVLGSEYCSGYMDALGKWNNGFYCPASDESQDVFCCGSDYHKYCCTKKDQVIQSEVQDITVLVGIILGASAAILILTLVSCFCCSCCLLYKKRNPSSSSMYRLHNASEHSGVTNMYSLSNAGGSRANTPLPTSNQRSQQYLLDDVDHVRFLQNHNGGIAHSYTLPHNLSHHGKHQNYIQQFNAYNLQNNPDIIASTHPSQPPHHQQQQQQQQQHHHHHHHHDQHNLMARQYGTLGRMPREHPPPYQDFANGHRSSFFANSQQLGSTNLITTTAAISFNGGDLMMHHQQHQQQQQPQEQQQQQQQQLSGLDGNQDMSGHFGSEDTSNLTQEHQAQTPQGGVENGDDEPVSDQTPMIFNDNNEDQEGLFHSTKF